MKMNKRGTHVGVILSFLIFVTFLAFLYSITEPVTRVRRDKLDVLEHLQFELFEEFTEDMSTITINVSRSNCLVFDEFDPGLRGWGVVAKYRENILPSHRDGTKTEVDCQRGTIKLYYSKEFGDGSDLTPCSPAIEDDDYEIRIFRTTGEIFDSTIINISNYINANVENYEEIKKRLKVPLGDEFGFTFKDGEGKILAIANEKNVSIDIYAEEIPIQYIDNEANINPGFLSIRVW